MEVIFKESDEVIEVFIGTADNSEFEEAVGVWKERLKPIGKNIMFIPLPNGIDGIVNREKMKLLDRLEGEQLYTDRNDKIYPQQKIALSSLWVIREELK